MRLAALEGQAGRVQEDGRNGGDGSIRTVSSADAGSARVRRPDDEGVANPLTSGDALTGEDDSDAGVGSSGALSQFASDALGQALSVRGGFGIADRIVHELSHSGKPSGTGKVTGNLHGNTANQTNE